MVSALALLALLRPSALEQFRFKTESWNRSIYLFLRIILHKTATHFC